jgi:hypothetical protein
MEFHAKVFHAKAGRNFSQRRKDATLALTVYKPQINRIVTVQECDATMLKKEQMQET